MTKDPISKRVAAFRSYVDIYLRVPPEWSERDRLLSAIDYMAGAIGRLQGQVDALEKRVKTMEKGKTNGRSISK